MESKEYRASLESLPEYVSRMDHFAGFIRALPEEKRAEEEGTLFPEALRLSRAHPGEGQAQGEEGTVGGGGEEGCPGLWVPGNRSSASGQGSKKKQRCSFL